jgi:flagellar biosynthesis/type III secretory pathway chaperone
MLLMGVWLATRRGDLPDTRTLAERREQLFKELTQLEQRRRDGAVSADRFATRRRRLMADLEQIYSEIDGTAAGPQGGGEGVAA